MLKNLLEKNLFYKYPYIDASGQLKYFSEEDGTTVSPELIKLYNSAREVGSTFNYDLDTPVRMDKDLTSENLMSERYFKLAVLAWLTDGEIKLFRSPGEGNYLVRLLNTSLTPIDTVGRMLHTFNTTAYEIADLTYDNLLKYKLISLTDPSKNLMQFVTTEFTPSYVDGEPQPTVLYESTDGSTIYAFEVNDCMPGDQVRITYADDNTSELITIGITGSFRFEANGRPISKIEFLPTPEGSPTYPRSITIDQIGEAQNFFDLLSSVSTSTVLGRTYYGP